VRDYARIYGLPTVVFRQSSIYGPRQFGVEDQGWIAFLAICAATGQPITIYGDGKQVRDILYIDDLARAFEAAGHVVLRCDLPFRQQRPAGPPFPAMAARDREGLRLAVQAARQIAGGRIFLGGHSYGGRQSTILAASDPGVADALLLLSYPLHPPRKPEELRTAHFPDLRTPSLFVHGARDPFGSVEKMRAR